MPNVLADPSTIGTVTGHTQAYLVRKALTRLNSNTLYHKMGKATPLPKGGGTTVTWVRYTNFTRVTGTLTQDINPSPTWLSNATVSTTIELIGGFTPIGESLKLHSVADPLTEIGNLVGDWAAQTADLRIRDRLFGSSMDDENPSNDGAHLSTFIYGIQGGFSTLFLSSDGTKVASRALFYSYLTINPTAFVEDDWAMNLRRLDDVAGRLDANSVDKFPDGNYHAILDPKSVRQLFRDPEFRDMVQFNGWQTNVMGKPSVAIHGIRIFQSNNNFITNSAPLSTAATTFSAAFSLIVGEEAYGVTGFGAGNSGESYPGIQIIRKVSGPNDTSNPLSLYETYGFKLRMATAVLDRQRGFFLVTLQT